MQGPLTIPKIGATNLVLRQCPEGAIAIVSTRCHESPDGGKYRIRTLQAEREGSRSLFWPARRPSLQEE